MANPLISFIVPFYGKADEQLFDDCLQSIARQGVREHEVIVCRDGSRGLGGARNEGITRARGEYLMFVDADDRLVGSRVGDILRRIPAEERPDIVSFGVQTSERQQPAPRQEPRFYPTGADYMLHNNFLGTAWRHLFSRELVERAGLRFAENRLHEDEDFVALAYLHARSTCIVPDAVYYYRRRSGSQSLSSHPALRQRRVDDFHAMLLRLQALLTVPPGLDSHRRAALARRLDFLTIDYTRQLLRNRLSPAECLRRLKELRHEGFLPLPPGERGGRYALARLALNTLSRI